MLSLAILITGLDMTVLNLALPTLAAELGASIGQLQWIVNAYVLVEASLLLPIGLLGDRLGRKKVLLIALALFGVASLFAAYATSAGALITARAVLGLGAAALVPLPFAMVPVMFTEAERPKAIGLLTLITTVAFPLGPIVGGWLLSHFWWGSVFLINVPVVIVTLVTLILLMPESRSEHRPRIDFVGMLISSAGLAIVTFGVIQAGERGWGDPLALTVIVAGLLTLAAFVGWERRISRRGQPLIELGLFRSASFTWGTILTITVFFAIFGLLFTLPQYFQEIQGTDPMGAGLRLLPVIGGLALGTLLAGFLARAIGSKFTVAAGFVLMAVGFVLAAMTGLDTGYGYVALWSVIIGAGFGVVITTAMDAALGELSAERSGVGSALIQAMQRVGSAFGVAILGSVLNGVYRNSVDVGGLPPAAAEAVKESLASGVAVAQEQGSAALLRSASAAFVDGMTTSFLLVGAVSLAGIVLAVVFLPHRVVKTQPPESVATTTIGPHTE
ncbi:DHA2 family efflux MFS transporter permease subunit [Nonomuraea sp. NPDC002799]